MRVVKTVRFVKFLDKDGDLILECPEDDFPTYYPDGIDEWVKEEYTVVKEDRQYITITMQ